MDAFEPEGEDANFFTFQAESVNIQYFSIVLGRNMDLFIIQPEEPSCYCSSIVLACSFAGRIESTHTNYGSKTGCWDSSCLCATYEAHNGVTRKPHSKHNNHMDVRTAGPTVPLQELLPVNMHVAHVTVLVRLLNTSLATKFPIPQLASK